MTIKHWVSKLPEFGTTQAILVLLDEQREVRGLAREYAARDMEIDREIESLVANHWSKGEIGEARREFEAALERENKK